MTLYCGIDLHSNNQMVVVIDDRDRRLLERRVPNDLDATLNALAPFKADLLAVAVESTYNWYWLVDGLSDHGYSTQLVNTAKVEQYSGLKYSDDQHDAFWLAHLMRLGILPTGYICPREIREVRDLLRKRLGLVRERARNLTSVQNILARELGHRVPTSKVRGVLDADERFRPAVRTSIAANLAVIETLDTVIAGIQTQVLGAIQPTQRYQQLKTLCGVGDVLAPTIALETGEIERFKSVGNYSSYCRVVESRRESNERKKGAGNKKCGNRYLAWAFSEAAHFAVRYNDRARRFFDRKAARRNRMVAIRAVAHKLARAAYFVQRDRVPFDAARLFG
ncbi:IS110 family transposase [Wenzhouxiangella sp. XN79A]|uniref:IS110 family transposase n=1 Tax=Wenzhouxiangella sp. XN79A TaxID=2724193 RepID=UPI00144AAC52|nr:IS110 family transposase [Wenzhouxiangella sp. XN79A]NKI34723.1 IS110 family transposase [Wenzhouxiangella sp. XN79A]NKI34731.1 IS110 family transposase [Wenzhouxiangella sp. XN79A]NKI36296.1 IS110 family transposase [Wenzhouxiangella sp. XN79A]NKI36623.1 IS110 family transposase [Wenzhouxiangella sp. XN79A]